MAPRGIIKSEHAIQQARCDKSNTVICMTLTFGQGQ